MTIKGILQKEKSISVNQFMSARMRIAMNRTNLMPENISGSNLQCEIRLNIIISGENSQELAVIKLSNIVVAVLDDDDVYDKEECAERLFKALNINYICAANELLKESQFPPLPLDIQC